MVQKLPKNLLVLCHVFFKFKIAFYQITLLIAIITSPVFFIICTSDIITNSKVV